MLENTNAYILIRLTNMTSSTNDTRVPNETRIRTLLQRVDFLLLFDDDHFVHHFGQLWNIYEVTSPGN